MATSLPKGIALPFLFLLALVLSSCAGSIATSVFKPALENMQQQTDIQLVCEGTPPYLLMLDSLIASDPGSEELLRLGAKAYSGYIGAMTECQMENARIQTMADKAKLYGKMLLSPHLPITPENSLEELDDQLQSMTKGDVPNLFWGVFSWITWVQQQKGSPSAMADLTKIEKILVRIVALDAGYQDGAAHFFLGAYYSSRPKLLGGDPEKGRFHFEEALRISKRKMLIYQTIYAQTLARMTMDQELHNLLLREVINFKLDSYPEKTLSNLIAKNKAKQLLEEEYFRDE